MSNLFYHQGDVLLKKIGNFTQFRKSFAEIPKTAKPVKTNLVLKGNTNSHALYGGKFEILKDNGQVFVRVTKPTKLDHVQDHLVKKPKHAEHHAQEIEVGEYWLDSVMEYDHALEESRQVID